MNIKSKNWRDLLTEDEFQKSDLIHLQDPLTFKNRVLAQFEHVAKGLDIPKEEKETSCFRNINSDTKRILKSLGTKEAKDVFEGGGGGKREQARLLLAQAQNRQRPASEETKKPKILFKPGASTWDTRDELYVKDTLRKRRERECDKKIIEFNPNGKKVVPSEAYAPFVQYQPGLESTGAMASGLTSTVMKPVTKNARKMIRVERRPKKKGYVRIHTNLGHLNVELHCDLASRTCENFLGLCEIGYFDDTIFHRSIKDFMIQGGDPTGTGKGGESIYGPTFKDEFDNRLTHSGRGVLSMANSGPHTNSSQFFILYNSAHHLNLKHTVFGKLVGGMETLTAMEGIETDDEDRPLKEIRIQRVSIFCNPYKEMMDEEKMKVVKEEIEADDPKGSWFSDPAAHAKERENPNESNSVGKYLKKRKNPDKLPTDHIPKPSTPKQSYGDFSSW